MKRPAGLPWLLWLSAFLLVEIPAAIRKSGTFSAWVWDCFAGPVRRSVLGAFMVTLTAHFVWQASPWWLLTALPVAAVIVDAVWRGNDMTREEWDSEWSACFSRLRAKGWDILKAQEQARLITLARYGKRPAGTPLWMRLALKVITRKLEANPMTQRILTSISFAFAVGGPLYTAAVLPESPGGAALTWVELFLIVWPALAAGYGNYKSNTTKIMPNRTEWTPEQRLVQIAKMDASVKVADAKVVAEEKVASAKASAEKR